MKKVKTTQNVEGYVSRFKVMLDFSPGVWVKQARFQSRECV
jgi:hypothetical protein